jgi:hypothetical protein
MLVLFSHFVLFLPIPDEDAKLSVVQPVISICIKLGKCNLDLEVNINQIPTVWIYGVPALCSTSCRLSGIPGKKECVKFIKKFLVLMYERY